MTDPLLEAAEETGWDPLFILRFGELIRDADDATANLAGEFAIAFYASFCGLLYMELHERIYGLVFAGLTGNPELLEDGVGKAQILAREIWMPEKLGEDMIREALELGVRTIRDELAEQAAHEEEGDE